MQEKMSDLEHLNEGYKEQMKKLEDEKSVVTEKRFDLCFIRLFFSFRIFFFFFF